MAASFEWLSVCLLGILFATGSITVSAQSDTLDRLETLEQKLALYEDKITTLQALIETRNTIIRRQAKLINNFEELTGIGDNVTGQEREPERVDQTDPLDVRTPAFSASGQMYRDAPDEYGNNINVIINEGPGFDEQRRIFTCGIPGLYLFHAAIRSPGADSEGNSTAEGRIVMNGETLVGMRVDPFHEGQSLSVSNSVIKRLEEGDQVWLDVTSDQDIVEYTWRFHSTFSGTLLSY